MELLFIYMDGCPYCRLANEVLEDLFATHPEYKKKSSPYLCVNFL